MQSLTLPYVDNILIISRQNRGQFFVGFFCNILGDLTQPEIFSRLQTFFSGVLVCGNTKYEMTKTRVKDDSDKGCRKFRESEERKHFTDQYEPAQQYTQLILVAETSAKRFFSIAFAAISLSADHRLDVRGRTVKIRKKVA